MLDMTWAITIGKYKLRMLESVTIVRSVELLSDTAEIVLPATAYNNTLKIEEQITRGDAVTIDLGYDGKPLREFTGYVQSIATDGGSLTIKCEDEIFQFRKSLANREIKNAEVNDIISAVVKELGLGLTVSCSYTFKYDKFVFSNATGYDVLKKIQEEAKPNIYIKNNVLHVHPQYSEIFGAVKYDFARNIDREGTDLKYKKATDRKVEVIIEYTDAKGKAKKYTTGDTGGEKITEKVSTTDAASIANLAKQIHVQSVYDGYEGSITGWLVPWCDAGYKATITDAEYEYKNGTYYVIETKVDFSQSGGKRIVKLGKKIS